MEAQEPDPGAAAGRPLRPTSPADVVTVAEAARRLQMRKEDVDRAKIDDPSSTCVVLARTEADNYVIGNKAGVFKDYVSRSYLTPVPNATAVLVGLEGILADYLDEEKNPKLRRVGTRELSRSGSAAGWWNGVGWCDGVCSPSLLFILPPPQVDKAFFTASARPASVRRTSARASRPDASATRVATKATKGARTTTRG